MLTFPPNSRRLSNFHLNTVPDLHLKTRPFKPSLFIPEAETHNKHTSLTDGVAIVEDWQREITRLILTWFHRMSSHQPSHYLLLFTIGREKLVDRRLAAIIGRRESRERDLETRTRRTTSSLHELNVALIQRRGPWLTFRNYEPIHRFFLQRWSFPP